MGLITDWLNKHPRLGFRIRTNPVVLALRRWRYDFKMRTGEVTTCPRRMHEIGPWPREEGHDRWIKTGGDRTCSFCGSWHPDEFLAWLKAGIDGIDNYVSLADGRHKAYVHRRGIKNAGEGAIKFYFVHGKHMIDELLTHFYPAHRKTIEMEEQRWNKTHERMIKAHPELKRPRGDK